MIVRQLILPDASLAKGTILVATGNGFETLAPAPANGMSLVSDDTTATGVKWAVVEGGGGTTGDTFDSTGTTMDSGEKTFDQA